MAFIKHIGGVDGQFVADCDFGRVVLTTLNDGRGQQVYTHPDGRTATCPIAVIIGGRFLKWRGNSWKEITAAGVEIYCPGGLVGTYEWK